MRTTPFKPGVFAPFLDDVEQARRLPPLGPEDLAGTPLEARVAGLLLQRDGHWTGLVTLSGPRDPAAMQRIAAATSGVTLLDLKQASEDLVAHQRERILWCLAGSALLLVRWCASKQAMEAGMDPLEAITKGYMPGVNNVGDSFACGNVFLPELVMAGEAMKAAIAILEPELKKAGTTREILGKVVLATVEGDIHEIGKSLVGTMLTAAGFEVHDLGQRTCG